LRGWRGGGDGLGFRVEGYGLEAFELAEGVAVVALGGVDHALEAGEGVVASGKGVSERGVAVECDGAFHCVCPDLGFGCGEAAEGPGGADEDIDEVALLGDGGVEALEIFVEEGIELGAIFAGNDEGLGIDAGLQGVHGGTGLALGGAWARGGVRVGAIGAAGFHRNEEGRPDWRSQPSAVRGTT
jgi:hypothetical protein